MKPEKKLNSGLFSSDSDEWETPMKVFDPLNEEFGFTLDPCATPENAKCERFFTIEDDGLSRRWDGVVFCNPPYGRQIKWWVRKALESSQAGALVVMLIPARTDTSYWHDYIFGKAEVRFLRGRIHFSDKGPAPFPSAVVVFRPE